MKCVNITFNNDLEWYDEMMKKNPKQEYYYKIVNLYRKEPALIKMMIKNFCKKQKIISLLNGEKGEIFGYGFNKDARPIYIAELYNSLKPIILPVDDITSVGFNFMNNS